MWAQLEPLRFRAEPEPAPDPEATLLSGDPVGQAPRLPGSRPATAAGAAALQAPTKSKLPLYGGLAVAALLLLIGGVFFLLPKKEEPLTLAQIAMAKRDAEARAAATVERALRARWVGRTKTRSERAFHLRWRRRPRTRRS